MLWKMETNFETSEMQNNELGLSNCCLAFHLFVIFNLYFWDLNLTERQIAEKSIENSFEGLFSQSPKDFRITNLIGFYKNIL